MLAAFQSATSDDPYPPEAARNDAALPGAMVNNDDCEQEVRLRHASRTLDTHRGSMSPVDIGSVRTASRGCLRV